ncbi:MAG: ATP-binding protein [Stappiaceae bacterium]
MKSGLQGYRIALLVGLVVLALLMTVMVTNLLSQLRNLSTAEGDNNQWSISQLDTEFANLAAILSKQISKPSLSDDEVRLRLDIALSRLAIINSGRAAALFKGNEETKAQIDTINAFAEQAVNIADKPGILSREDFIALQTMTDTVRPAVRKIALTGVSIGAQQSEYRRDQFARQLKLTGGTAIGLLVVMAAMLLFLGHLLTRAQQRDTALKESTLRLESTVEASLDGIITADESGKIIEYNSAAERVLGWTRQEILGRTMEATIIPHKFRDAHREGMERFLKTREPHVVDAGRIELTALRKTGEEFPIELNITSVEGKESLEFIAYIRDISERKIDEQKLIDARDRAERTDKAKSQFLAVMSHEMRTPLNGILGVLDLLKTTPLSEKQSRYTGIATASSEILLEHINEALDITRIETGTLSLVDQKFDLAELLSGIIDVLEPLAVEKNLTMNFEFDEHLRIPFYGDGNRIRQVVINLLGNAIKFTDKGTVGLKVSGIHGPSETSLYIAVSDTGPGIDPEHQGQIFEDFVVLAHSEGRQSRGDGLGLSISRKIARKMDGDIKVNSAIGAGTTFTLTVPLTRADHSELEDETQKLPTEGKVEKSKGYSILVVEDNDINRSILKDMLMGMGHSVSEAENGVECLALAEKSTFDLVFMDISMPVMNGIEAARRLRAGESANKFVPIIGLTAHGREEYREQAQLAGMTQFQTKPIRLPTLHTILDNIFASSVETPHAEEHVLQELCGALGSEKVSKTGTALFNELRDFMNEVAAGNLAAGTPELAEAAHKLKGATALLGMRSLEHILLHMENTARSGQRDNSFSVRLHELKQTAISTEAAFNHYLNGRKQPSSSG